MENDTDMAVGFLKAMFIFHIINSNVFKIWIAFIGKRL